MKRVTFVCGVVAFLLRFACAASATAFNFQEPADWIVGEVGSTYQNWAIPFMATESPPSASQANPVITSSSTMSAQLPGFVGSSGGYYAFGADYQISAEVFNHGGTAGDGGPYSSDSGTRVIIQTAATTNPDFDVSVFPDSIELVDLDGTPIFGGTNDDLLCTTELFRQEVQTPYGAADQEELAFEFLLPNYISDFQVRFTTSIHSSFFDLRIDTFIVDTANTPGDFDGDGKVDGNDLASWQSHYGIDAGTDADGDGDSDGADFLAWQRNYTGPNQAMVVAVPEPAAIVQVVWAAVTLGLFTRPKRSAN